MSGAQINFLEEIVVDNLAGGGGASTGIELATGRPVTIAINHDPDAILMLYTVLDQEIDKRINKAIRQSA